MLKRALHALLAQLDRAFGYEPKGRGFESLKARHFFIYCIFPFAEITKLLFMTLTQEYCNFLMDEALQEAALAGDAGDVPIGAVVAIGDQIIARAHNQIECNKDATAHAEILAIRSASRVLNDWRLNDAILCVTLEPCPMCAAAIRQCRLGTVIFGAFDPVRGGMGSLFDLSLDTRLGSPLPRIISSIREDKCKTVLQDFFKSKR